MKVQFHLTVSIVFAWSKKEQHNRAKKNVIGKKPSTIAPFPKQQRKEVTEKWTYSTTTSTFRWAKIHEQEHVLEYVLSTYCADTSTEKHT